MRRRPSPASQPSARRWPTPSCATKAALLPGDTAACAAPYRGAVLVLGDSVTVDASEWSVESIRMESNTSTGIRTQSFRFE